MGPKRKEITKEDGSNNGISSKNDSKKVKTDSNLTCDANIEKAEKWNLKILSWNVDGMRAWLKKGGLASIAQEDPDIFCLQETKCSDSKIPDEIKNLKGYKSTFYAAKKEGYSGVAWFSKQEAISVSLGFKESAPIHDDEGRCITAEYDNFYLVAAYVPNSGRKLVTLDKRMDWDEKLKTHLTDLDKMKPVIYCGDLNVAHNPIDLANPKTNKRNAGFTDEERNNFTALLEEGFVDSFRYLYPEQTAAYTFWTYMMNCRAKNVGWRLDYFVLSKRLLPNLFDNEMKNSLLGSDHCPISLLMNF